MEDVAGVDVEPPHVGGTVLAGHDPDPRAVRVHPPVRHAAAPGQGVVEDDGQVHPHDVVLGDGEVVHHRRPGHVDRPAVEQLALRGDPVVGEIGRREPGPEQVQFTGDRVLLRVRGHRGGQLPAEVVRPDGLQLRGDPVRQADLAQGEDGVGVPDHVGVRGRRGQVDGAVLTDEGVTLQLPCLHPPVAVPLGPPAAQPDAVQHAGPGEPVPSVLAGQRVGAVAEIAAVQVGGQGAAYGQLGGGVLLGDRGEAALEVEGRGGLVGHAGFLQGVIGAGELDGPAGGRAGRWDTSDGSRGSPRVP